MTRVLYVLACGAPPAKDVGVLVQLARDRGWDACVITSPRGRTFVDVPALEELTGHPVRSEYKLPAESDVLPPPDAIIVAPATTNTINKWAAGIQDTLLLGLIVEGIGKRLPIVAMPIANQAQAAHPAFGESIAKLRSWGVTILHGPEVFPLPEPGAGGSVTAGFPWHLTLDALPGYGEIDGEHQKHRGGLLRQNGTPAGALTRNAQFLLFSLARQ
jgi:hypothetical protein